MPPTHTARYSPLSSARGLGLLDALIALAVLSLSFMALTQTQLQQHINGRSATHRASAIHLIADIHERMLLNREAAETDAYLLQWAQTAQATDCESAPCSSAQRAQADLHHWLGALASMLPEGQARIFRSADHPRQIGVMVRWAHIDALAAPSPGSSTACPANTLCHLSYVEI